MSNDVRRGLRGSLGIAASTFALGVSYGALARTHGWGVGAPVVASIAVFSGSAQFAVLTGLAGGGAVWAAVASAVLINLRFFPMGLAVSSALPGGRVRRALQAQAIVDGSFVLAHEGHGRFNPGVLLGSALAQWPAWVAGTVLGVILAPSPHTLQATGLDVVFPAFFALLLLDEMRRARAGVVAALGGVLISGLLLLILPPGAALLGGAAGALAGLRSDGRRS